MCKMQANSRKIIRLSLYTFFLLFIIAFDQITKVLAIRALKGKASYPLWKDVFHFTYYENRGAAFGMLADNRFVFLILSTLAIVGIAVWLYWKWDTDSLSAVSLLMVLGGGVGNMIDRIAKGYVVDFLDFTLIDFAIFNVADSFVCVGAVLLCIAVLRKEWKDQKKKTKEQGHEGDG